jgi:hypothetical protein
MKPLCSQRLAQLSCCMVHAAAPAFHASPSDGMKLIPTWYYQGVQVTAGNGNGWRRRQLVTAGNGNGTSATDGW